MNFDMRTLSEPTRMDSQKLGTMRTLYPRTFFVLIAFLSLPFMANAQGGPVFSQPFSAPLRTNPSLMSANKDIHIGIGYRAKWSGFEQGYQTPRFTFMMPVMVDDGSKLDVGLSVLNDQAGAFSRIKTGFWRPSAGSCSCWRSGWWSRESWRSGGI